MANKTLTKFGNFVSKWLIPIGIIHAFVAWMTWFDLGTYSWWIPFLVYGLGATKIVLGAVKIWK